MTSSLFARRAVRGLALCGLGLVTVGAFRPSDHADTPLLIAQARHDARITDLYSFVRGDDLVLVLCTDPTVPPGVSSYTFPSDLKLEIAVDNDSRVSFGDPVATATYGGEVVEPKRINEDIRFRIAFKPNGTPKLKVSGMSGNDARQIQLFAGLRDDPFIRAPRTGRNVAAVVLSVPLASVLDGQDTLLVWATSKVPGLDGPFQEMVGRSFRSQLDENLEMNVLHPKLHEKRLGVPPDVMIYDTSRPAAFPNGRELADDVVDLVGLPGVIASDAPFPTTNDVPFLTAFPYLAPPQ